MSKILDINFNFTWSSWLRLDAIRLRVSPVECHYQHFVPDISCHLLTLKSVLDLTYDDEVSVIGNANCGYMSILTYVQWFCNAIAAIRIQPTEPVLLTYCSSIAKFVQIQPQTHSTQVLMCSTTAIMQLKNPYLVLTDLLAKNHIGWWLLPALHTDKMWAVHYVVALHKITT